MVVGVNVWYMNYYNKHYLTPFQPSLALITNIFSEFEFLISNGMLFQMIAPEYDKLFLNKFSFGLGIEKFLLVTDRKLEIVSSEEFLI